MGPDLEWSTLRHGIRMRPAMYLGGTDPRGLHDLVWHLTDSLAEESTVAATTTVGIEIRDGEIAIEDDGEGVSGRPLEALGGRSLLEAAVTTHLKNGRLRTCAESSHSIGLPQAAALGETFRIESTSEGRRYGFELRKGEIVIPVCDLGPADQGGTRIEWRPDPTIFADSAFDIARIRGDLRFLSAFHPGLRFSLQDGSAPREEFFAPSGMADHVRHLLGTDPVRYLEVLSIQFQEPGLALDVAFTHRTGDASWVETYANGWRTIGHGAHWRGFQRGIMTLLRAKAAEDRTVGRSPPDWRSFARGLMAVLSIDAAHLYLEGPSHDRVTNDEMEAAIASAIERQLGVVLSQHPSLLSKLLERSTPRSEGRERQG